MRIALLDGYNLMHRSRFGAKGENGIIYTFFRSLRPLIAEIKPDKIYLVLEGVPVHRQALDSSYKANRQIEQGTPKWDEMAEFRRQKRVIVDLLGNLPITVAKNADLECDDVIASLTHVHEGDECVIVSTDTDFIQLLDRQNVKLYNPVRKEYVERAPFDYLRWKALRGDKTDNIPPVPGATDKAAEKLLADPQKLEKFLAEGDNRAYFQRNLELVGFKIISADKIEMRQPDGSIDTLRSKLQELRFFSMVNDTAWGTYSKTFAPIYG